MLSHLTVTDVLAIIDAASALRRDDQAMQEYLHPGADGFFTIAELAADAGAGAFDSPEHRRLTNLVNNLSRAARHELIALMFVGRGDTQDFARALVQAKGSSVDGDVRYVTAKPLEVYLPAALETLGLKRPG